MNLSLVRVASAAAAVSCLALFSQAQTIGCTTGGPGGVIPTSGTGGGGVYPTTMPPADLALPLAVASVPPGSTCVTEVKMYSLVHTYGADVQIVLEAPGGAKYNLWAQANSYCDYSGDYTVIPAAGATLPTCTGLPVTPGSYDQYYGTWTSGTNGIDNTDLSLIPPAVGTWTLRFYDWYGGDVGSIASWDLCFGTPPPPPPPSAAPTLLSPANGSNVFSAPVTLTWGAVTLATTYDVDFDGTVTTGVATTSFNAGSPAVGLHTWTARGVNPSGAGPWATAFTFTIPGPPPASSCATPIGGSGVIPTSGTGGGGSYPTVLPTFPTDIPLAVTVPGGATSIVDIRLNGLEHTYAADLQFTLEDPSGVSHNLLCRKGGSNDFGVPPSTGYDYQIYESYGYSFATVTNPIAPGAYVQDFGTWPSGTNNIFNTPLGSVPVVSGTYTLHIYDWAGGDIGTLASWEICFNSPSGPTSYCTPTSPGTSNACVPTIAGNNNPNVAHSNSCIVTVSSVEGGQNGLIFYGVNGPMSSPWCAVGSNSFLCVKAPLERGPVQATGGAFGSCSGSLVMDWNAFQLANPSGMGNPWSVGDNAWLQGWFRDPPSCKTSFLSEALVLTYQ